MQHPAVLLEAVTVANEPWYQIVAPYVVALVSLGGLVLTAWWSRVGSHRAWLREQRLSAYSDLLGQSHQFVTMAIRLWNAPSTDPTRADDLRSMQSLVTLLDVAGNRVALVGPPTVGSAALAFVVAHNAVTDTLLDADYRARAQTYIGDAASFEELQRHYREFHALAAAAIQ